MSQEQDESFTINEKQEPINLDDEPKVALDESDPRAAIYAKHKEQRQAEVEGTPVGVTTDEPERQAEPKPEVDDEVTVKINGKEKRVPKAKIDEAGGVQAFQKQAAAAEELRLAKEERRRIQEFEQQLTAKAQELQRIEQEFQMRAVQQPAATPPPQDGELKQLASKYHEAILNGDIDQADELLLKIQGARPATPAFDADAVARKAAAEAKAAMDAERRKEQQMRFERERQEAVAKFEEEFSDIAEDPELRDWADQKTIRIARENPDWTPLQIIDEAARQVREATGRKVSAPSDKVEAKRNMTTVRGGSARATPKPVAKPPTPSQYVENLRKMRGLG